MAVDSITKYKQLDGREILKVRLKPTKKYPNGSWFYIDACFEDLVGSQCWFIDSDKWNDYVVAKVGSTGYRRTLLLHQEVAFKCLGRYPNYIDHENGLGMDNIGLNLTEVTNQQNQRNRQSRGYRIGQTYKSGGSCFRPQIKLNGRDKSVRREDEVCLRQFQFESANYTDYRYDFFKDRRGDLDIVDLERTGQITSDYATYLHVKRYVENNPWYAYRYNLFNYCSQNGIIIPNYELNTEGRMIDPVTNKILCPFG